MKYIAFEGIDGAGKTTQLDCLAKFLEQKGVTPIRLFEPTYGSYGSQAREMIASGQIGEREKLHELLMLDRKEHVEQRILPALGLVKKSKRFALLQDRCYLSAPAYQGTDHNDMVRLLREELSYAPKPDAIVFLRVPRAVAVERLRSKGDHHTSLTTSGVLESIQARYESIIEFDENDNILTVDGTGSEDEIHKRIIAVLELSHEH